MSKSFYNIASGKRAFWLVNMLDPFARGLHAHVSLFICTFSRRNKTQEARVALGYRLVRLLRFFRA